MGSEASRSSSDEDQAAKSEKLPLSSTQIRQIRNLWRHAVQKGASEPGRSILVAILSKAPEVEAIFNFASYASGPGGSANPKATDLALHAKRFNRELEFMIDHLDQPRVAREHFNLLGSRHVDFQGSGFTAKLWDVFADSMIEKTVEWGTRSQRNYSSQEAWGKIVLFIIDAMKTGFYDALKAKKRKSTNSNSASIATTPVTHENEAKSD